MNWWFAFLLIGLIYSIYRGWIKPRMKEKSTEDIVTDMIVDEHEQRNK
jgi:hypothetical protein